MKTYLGIDPGRSKTGLALVGEQGEILKLHIAQTAIISKEIMAFLQGEEPCCIVLGDGTSSKTMEKALREVLPELVICYVDEKHSTEEARVLYWQVNPPKGLKKLLPLGLLVPEEPMDAYAAVVQVRRYLKL